MFDNRAVNVLSSEFSELKDLRSDFTEINFKTSDFRGVTLLMSYFTE